MATRRWSSNDLDASIGCSLGFAEIHRSTFLPLQDTDPALLRWIRAKELSTPEEEIVKTARGMRNLQLFGDRLYFDENGILRLHPPPPIDDS